MSPRIKQILLVTLLISFLSACTSMKVRHDYAVDYDFATLKTYQWADRELLPSPLPLQAQRIFKAIDSALGVKGMTEAQSDPDALLRVKYRVERRQEIRPYSSFGYWRYDLFPRDIDFEVYEYDVGELTIELIEPKSNRVVWHGQAADRVDDSMTPEQRTQLINAAVQAIFERYPPLPAAQ